MEPLDSRRETLPFAEHGKFETDQRRSGSRSVLYYGADALKNHPRLDYLLLMFRILTFLFSLASVLVMAFDTHSVQGTNGRKLKWHHFDTYRYVLAANAIICIYSLAEIGMRLWTFFKGRSLMADPVAVWFDYSHDQGFAYLLFSASSAGTVLAKNLWSGNIHIFSNHTCDDVAYFCIQAQIAIGMSFAASLFIAGCSLLSGFRLATWLASL